MSECVCVCCWFESRGEMTNGGLAFSATSDSGGLCERALAPRRQVHARRGSKVIPLEGVGEESDSCSEASSRSCSFSVDVSEGGTRTFTKDGSPEVVAVCTPEREVKSREGKWEKSPSPVVRKKVAGRERGKPPRGARLQQQQVRQVQQSSRCCSVPAALPSAALYKQYGVYQNDLYTGETDSPHSEEENGNCTTSSSSSSEAGTPRDLRPKRLLRKLPGSPYDVEASHALARTLRRNPLCPFPRRSASPCPTRFSSVPPMSIPPDPVSMKTSPMFDRGKSWSDLRASHSNENLKILGKDVAVRKQLKQPQASKRKLYRGMSAPPVNTKGSSLPPSDHKLNNDVAAFANANGMKLLDLLKPGVLGIDFQKALEQGGFISPTKKTDNQTTSRVPKHMTSKSVLEKEAISTGLWRASILLPGCV